MHTAIGARPERAFGATASAGLVLMPASFLAAVKEPRRVVGERLKAEADASVCSHISEQWSYIEPGSYDEREYYSEHVRVCWA